MRSARGAAWRALVALEKGRTKRVDAALEPERHDFMYFVAWPDGSHEFTRSLTEHNVAVENARNARARTGS